MARISFALLVAGLVAAGPSGPAAAQGPGPGFRPPDLPRPLGHRGLRPPGGMPGPQVIFPGRGPGFPAGEPEVDDPRPFLDPKLAQALPRDVDPQNLKDALDKLNRLPRDQQPDRAQLEQLLKNNPAFKDPKFLQQLEKLLRDPNFPKNLEGKLPDGTPLPDKDQGPQLADKLKEVLESGHPNAGDPAVPDGPEVPRVEPNLPTPETPADAGPPNPYRDNEWVKWMEKNFGNSPAAQDAIKDMVDSMQKGDLKGMFDDLPEFKSGAWKDFEGLGKSAGGAGWDFKPPDLSLGNGGASLGGGGGGGSSWGGGGGGGSVGGGGSLDLAGGGTALLVIAGIGGALFLALLLFRRWKLDEARRLAQGAAGPTGIDFDAIRTREELVRAFDHVSLDQIGDEARTWNHRVVADQIAEARPAQAGPATELAGLYERARYAPQDEDLTAGEFASARQDLRAIAEPPA